MTVKELKEMLKHANDNDRVCLWSWFADGERIYSIDKTLMETEKRKQEYCGAGYFIIGGFDDRLLNRPDLLDKRGIKHED